jgi:hypothetical protein
MAEKSIPRAPRIEMVVVSPDYYGKNIEIFYHLPGQKTLDAMAKVVFHAVDQNLINCALF